LEKLIGKRESHFRLIELEKDQGKAEAVRQGILNAISSGARYVGYWDADLATPLSAIPDFLDQMKRQTDLLMVVGARVQLLGRKIVRKHYRHYLGRLFATLASIILRLPVYDTQCGAKLFVTDQQVVFAFREPFLSRWVFDVEIIARLIVETRVNARLAIY
jgi:dolichyl-phosphate beta-glucosyltransferase